MQHLRPPPNYRPSEWAEKVLRIPEGNKLPGPYRLHNAPYQAEPLDAMADPSVEIVTLKWGAQVGKTLIALIAIGYGIAVAPSSSMLMQPSKGDLQVWLDAKFEPMVANNPSLSHLIAKKRGKKGANNALMKSFPGGHLMFAWSGSPKTMRGRSAPRIICDEVDGYTRTKEGHAVGLLWQRSATFGEDRKLLQISTPTIKGESYISQQYEDGDMRQLWVPCGACKTFQVMTLEGIHWPGKDEEIDQDPESAVYVCSHCGDEWDDAKRVAAIRAGQWRALKPFRGHASFHLPEWYSLLIELKKVAKDYIAKKASDDWQSFVNVTCAEAYAEEVATMSESELMACREHYAAPVPLAALVLTAGVDMQEDRLEVQVVAWGPGEESWVIDYHVIWGDPAGDDEVWEELDEYLRRRWLHESGNLLKISAAGLDTGGGKGCTQAAYEYLRARTNRRIFGLKGGGDWGLPAASEAKHKKSGKSKRPATLFIVGVNDVKVTLARRLKKTVAANANRDDGEGAKRGPGIVHFSDTLDVWYFEQLTAEGLVDRKLPDGTRRKKWVQTRERNEALDTYVYAYAALKILKPSMRRAAERLAVAERPEASTPAAGPAPSPIEAIPSPVASRSPSAVPPASEGRHRRGAPARKSWVRRY
jgi:phage terminase large subunit GpA-like protein